MACTWNGFSSRWNKIKDNFFPNESNGAGSKVSIENGTSGIRYHDRVFILIPRLWPGYQEFRFIVTTQTKRVNYSWFIEDARGRMSLDAELLYKSASLLTTSSVRRMHYSLFVVFSRAVYFISIRSDRARWRAF